MGDNNKEQKLNEFSIFYPKPEWLDLAIQKYNEKLEFTNLQQKLSEIKEQMDINAIGGQVYTFNLQQKIKKILDKYGVILELYPHYMAFSFKLDKILKKFNPNIHIWKQDFIRELKILAQLWVNRGLDKNILKDIAKSLNAYDLITILDGL